MVMGMVVGVALMAGWSRVMQRRSRKRIAKVRVSGARGGDASPGLLLVSAYKARVMVV